MRLPIHILCKLSGSMAHVNRKAAEKAKESKIYGHLIKKTIRGMFVDVRSETPSISPEDVRIS